MPLVASSIDLQVEVGLYSCESRIHKKLLLNAMFPILKQIQLQNTSTYLPWSWLLPSVAIVKVPLQQWYYNLTTQNSFSAHVTISLTSGFNNFITMFLKYISDILPCAQSLTYLCSKNLVTACPWHFFK